MPRSLCHRWHGPCHGFYPQETVLSQEVLYGGIGEPLLPEIWERKTYLGQGRNKRKGREFRCMDAKHTILLGLQGAKWSWHASVSSADVTSLNKGQRLKGAGTPGQSCCRAPAAS